MTCVRLPSRHAGENSVRAFFRGGWVVGILLVPLLMPPRRAWGLTRSRVVGFCNSNVASIRFLMYNLLSRIKGFSIAQVFTVFSS